MSIGEENGAPEGSPEGTSGELKEREVVAALLGEELAVGGEVEAVAVELDVAEALTHVGVPDAVRDLAAVLGAEDKTAPLGT